MDAPGSLATVDLITADDLVALDAAEGPRVSVHMPTHRFGPETVQDAVRFHTLLDRAAVELGRSTTPAQQAEDLLAPLRQLADDKDFWQHQSDGLAAFAAPGRARHFRVNLHLAEQVVVGHAFHVAPLVPLLSGSGRFFLLAVSHNEVRLFDASRHRIGELALGPIPASIDEALAHEDPERQLQFRSAGGSAGFHGHGMGDEVDKATTERFLRAVDHGLRERVGALDQPLLLAAVGYYLPIWQSVSSYPNIVDAVVEGNPERMSAEDLHAAAWPLVDGVFTSQARTHLERFGNASGTGMTDADPDGVADAAHEGRVDTLFVAAATPADERFDRAILDTLTRGGRVVAVDEPVDGSSPVAALLRY